MPFAALAYDADSSGVSDVYEDLYGQLLPASEDADSDGYSNYQESLLGTNPLSAADPGDFNFEVSGESASMTVPNQVGLRYRLETSQTLGVDSWQAVGDFQVSDGQSGTATFDTTGLNASFFRIELAAPLHSDADGLDDWEEGQLGTDPLLADTDNDLLNDDIETMEAGSDPHQVDTDGDGFVDRDEHESGSDPADASSWPPEITSNAWSAPLLVRNESLPVDSSIELWSAPVSIRNESVPSDGSIELWSAPVLVSNASMPTDGSTELWSAPVLVRNEFLPVDGSIELWSAPILIRNTYEPAGP